MSHFNLEFTLRFFKPHHDNVLSMGKIEYFNFVQPKFIPQFLCHLFLNIKGKGLLVTDHVTRSDRVNFVSALIQLFKH